MYVFFLRHFGCGKNPGDDTKATRHRLALRALDALVQAMFVRLFIWPIESPRSDENHVVTVTDGLDLKHVPVEVLFLVRVSHQI